MTVRTRFAPSPTGYLHIGGVRTALFNWLLARQSGGQFILRIDDTDTERNIDSALQPILDGFKWLGIDWDEGPEVGGIHQPYFQSQRLSCYQAATQRLLESGKAYRDYATPQEVAQEREAAEREKRDFVYSRRWMAETEETCQKFEAEGRSFVVRLKMPREGTCNIEDLVRGEVSFDWDREQDHVIQRADGTCLYHLANVVDDHDFEITHVIRAVEHLSNTPRQIFIAESLGYQLPSYAHIPFVAEPGSKNKLSKRKIEQYMKNHDFKKLFDHGVAIANRIDLEVVPSSFNPVLVDFYRDIGFLPDAIVNYLLLVGWSLDDKTEDFSRQQMTDLFSLDRVVKSEASFDPEKLLVFQQRYMNELPLKQKVVRCLPFLQRAGLVGPSIECEMGPYLSSIIDAADDRITVAGDILQFDDFFIPDEKLQYDSKAFQKRLVKPENAGYLLDLFKGELAQQDDFKADPLNALLHHFCESQGIKIGQIIHGLRVAVTGKAAGFGMFETLEILGRERCIHRIERALEHLHGAAE
ncbi:MAG: glutamate--tRNA ligase [Mariniblastus sp.]|nr:glutamate--tRNA ligase [Mariniblastus sp.]